MFYLNCRLTPFFFWAVWEPGTGKCPLSVHDRVSLSAFAKAIVSHLHEAQKLRNVVSECKRTQIHWMSAGNHRTHESLFAHNGYFFAVSICFGFKENTLTTMSVLGFVHMTCPMQVSRNAMSGRKIFVFYSRTYCFQTLREYFVYDCLFFINKSHGNVSWKRSCCHRLQTEKNPWSLTFWARRND